MKKNLFLIFLLVGTYVNAQEQKKDSTNVNVLSAEIAGAVGDNIGLTFEYGLSDKQKILSSSKLKSSVIIKFYHTTATLESNNPEFSDVDGNGWGAELGSRTYFRKTNHRGFYYSNYLMSGKLKFESNNFYDTSEYGGDGKFYGEYQYLSFFSPELGFKFLISKRVAIDFHIGTAWLIEIKGKGDVDNRAFDNWIFKGGLSIGYNF